MESGFVEHYGILWPADYTREFAGLTIGKKWREIAPMFGDDRPDCLKEPWVPYIESMKSLFGDAFKVHTWAEEHVHDWVMYDTPFYWGCGSCGKSNNVGACALCDWEVDPRDTIVLVGSTTKIALRNRIWEAFERYLKILRSKGFPGKLSQHGFSILNDADEDGPASMKAGIHGVALNEGGTLQGAHLPYVRVIVDEIATITNHTGIEESLTNLRIAKDFKFAAMANPAPWNDLSSSIYCIPEDGIESVTVDSTEWMTTYGAHVRHNDGLKSPCILHPEMADEYPFLTQQKHVDAALRTAHGNWNSPAMWKMIRGFPPASGAEMPTVLSVHEAAANHVSDRMAPASRRRVLGAVAGIDPAWTEGGDGACRARAFIVEDEFGRPILDFTDGLEYLKIDATDRRDPMLQMMQAVINIMNRTPGEASFYHTAIDASGNQGLASALQIFAGADCLGVNFAERASESTLRAGERDPKPIRTYIKDRGSESWRVLAEFCRAGMVRGLPDEALRALTMRRSAVKPGTMTEDFPYRLERKADFKTRFGHSPDEADACALAALVAKERFGLVPWGYMPEFPKPDSLAPSAPVGRRIALVQDDDYAMYDVNVDYMSELS